MAITEQTPYNSYTGDGSTTVFPYTFKIFAATDIVAYEDGVSTGAVTVSGVGEESGGDVTFSVAPASGVVVLLNREIPYNRLTDYQTSGDLLADTLDADLDRIECQIQQLNQRSVDSIVAIAPGEDYTADGRKITDVATPEDSGDAANKGYVDGIAADFTMGAIPDGTIDEAKLSLSDVTTLDVSTSKHGFVPKAPADTAKYLRGDGTWSALPSASETAAGVIELATSAEALAGTDTERAVTSAGLASAKLLSTNGYQKLPGGLIIQWGRSQYTTNIWNTTTFPITFPTACQSISMILEYIGTTAGVFQLNQSSLPTTSSFQHWLAPAQSGLYFRWFAIGY